MVAPGALPAKRPLDTGALAKREIGIYPQSASMSAWVARGCGVRRSA